MKKIHLFIWLFMGVTTHVFSQAILFTEAPVFDNSTSTGRGPNGTANHVYMRGCGLVKATELTNIATGATISTFGFTLNAGASANAPVGNFTVYLQNTNDVSYAKGTSFTTAIVGMTQVYANTMTIPISAGSTSVTVTLSTPFVYTGGGIYVAYDWYCPGPYSSSAVVYRCNSGGLSPGMATNASASGPAPDLLGTTAFRPCFLWGVTNTYTNELSVTGMEAPGRLSGLLGTTHSIVAHYRNNSNQTRSNIVTTVNVSGANTFVNTQTITSLAAGAVTTVTFSAFTPLAGGLNTITVSLPSDENNANNSMVYTQSITCNEWALNPAAVNYTMGSVGFNTGSGILAVKYANPSTATLTGIRAGVANNVPSVGNGVWGVLLSATGNTLATTNTITLTSGHLGTSPVFTFATPPVLAPTTTYYIGFAQPTGTAGYHPMGTYTTAYVPFTNYVTTTTLGGTPAPLTANLGYFKIEALFTPTFAVSTNSANVVCGTIATLVATTPGTYSWTAGPMNSNYTVVPLSSTVYTVNASNTFGCASSSTAAVVVTPVTISANASSVSICSGATVTLTASGASSYSWSAGPATSSASFTDSPVNTTVYNVQGTTTAGCTNSAAVSVTVFANPTLTVSGVTGSVICGSLLTFSASANSNYAWTGGPSNTVLAVTATSSAVYTAVATNSDNCATTKTIGITVIPLTVNAAGSPTVICAGETVSLNVSGAQSYTWNQGPSPNSASFTIAPLASTVFVVTGGAASPGCEVSSSVAVTVNSFTDLAVMASSGTVICLGETSVLTASGGVTYSWSATTPGPSYTVTPTTSTVYSVTGIDANGCSASMSITLQVEACTAIKNDMLNGGMQVYPNPFNDRITIVVDPSMAAGRLVIYNIIGEEVMHQELAAGETTIDLSGAKRGIYMLMMEKDNRVLSTKKIVKQ